jgi:predicted nucleic acid-binding protein
MAFLKTAKPGARMLMWLWKSVKCGTNGATPGKKLVEEIDKPRFVLDSTVVINHLNKKLNADTFFNSIPEYELYISIVTEIETLSKPSMTEEEKQEAKVFLARFKTVNIIPAIKDMTIEIRQITRLKLPDAVIAATAVILNATLLSNDPHHLKKFVWPGLKTQAI